MTNVTTIRAIGNSDGVIIPKEMLADLNMKSGDTLFVTRTANGLELSPYDPDLAADMNRADDISRRYRNTLHNLAK